MNEKEMNPTNDKMCFTITSQNHPQLGWLIPKIYILVLPFVQDGIFMVKWLVGGNKRFGSCAFQSLQRERIQAFLSSCSL